VPREAYNTEYGVPLALFDVKVPTNPRDLLAWAGLLIKMFGKLFIPSPFKRIVLEYGADKAGDISYLTSFTSPHIALVTTVLPVHIEGFGTIEAIAKEKSKLVSGLRPTDFAILNFDNEYVRAMADQTVARIVSFGKKDADIIYSGLKYSESGMALDVTWKGSKYSLNIPVAAPQLLPSYLGAFAIGLLLGEDPRELTKRLSQIKSEHGRMSVLPGIRESTIIDDSYNSNPESAKAALSVLAEFHGRKIAVLGSMNELGDFSEAGHRQVGEKAAKVADIVITVGTIAGEYMYPVVAEKLNKKFVQRFDTAKEAGMYLKERILKGDVLLFKGSQNGVFTEEAVKCVMLHPEQAGELLVRQGPMWQNKKGL
jgi:UDP-N-acetylmuramoyl-tripeptide--D-alanyl-D-alanine ligase